MIVVAGKLRSSFGLPREAPDGSPTRCKLLRSIEFSFDDGFIDSWFTDSVFLFSAGAKLNDAAFDLSNGPVMDEVGM